MSRDSYTVPTLSLSGSRSRKNIPTKDVYQNRGYSFQNSSVSLASNNYLDKKQEQSNNKITQSRTSLNYYNNPPKPRNLENKPPLYPKLQSSKLQSRQISRNVYLSSQEQSAVNANSYNLNRQHGFQSTTNQTIQRARYVLGSSNSKGNLLRNPQSRLQIENEVKAQTNNLQFRKIDINKALFERKLTKLFQEIDFYEEELNSLHKDSLQNQIQQLQKMKEQSVKGHSKIMRDLNALLA